MKKWLCIILLIVLVVVISGGVWFYFKNQRTPSNSSKSKNPVTNTKDALTEIPTEILKNKFGWLGGGSNDDGRIIVEMAGAWVRPHPGPLVWDMMQKTAAGEIDFSNADDVVKVYQKNNLGLLLTFWPFAEWDQKNLSNVVNCQVSNLDEFLNKNDKKGRGSYLPQSRCNPNDWSAYQKWVNTVVERYDGDGQSDMPGLRYPIKHWEVMNEPDLSWKPGLDSDRLSFYKQGPAEYGELLKQTYIAIKQADKDSEVLIAGAAGGSSNFLEFYQTLFTNMKDASDYFDIGNVHCISNDEQTRDYNVTAYKQVLTSAAITKSIWVTEAEAFYRENTTADQNYESTKTSVTGALAAGAEKIFFTRYSFDDFRTDMSQKIETGKYPNEEKYRDIIKSYLK